MLSRLAKMGSLALLLGMLFLVSDAPAAPDAERITKLIAQLGNDQFRLREHASKELDLIGESALVALEEATNSEDMEVRRRASDLVLKIKTRVANAKRLAPTFVELTLKETPVTEAVALLAKQTGYKITLQGDINEFASRKITLETGKIPFWHALDMLCEKADLVEAEVQVAGPLPNVPQIQQRFQIAPAIMPVPVQIAPARIVPARIVPLVPKKDEKAEPKVEPKNDAPKKEVPKQGAQKLPVKQAVQIAQVQAQQIQQIQVQVQQIQVQAQAIQVQFDSVGSTGSPATTSITLIDAKGKPKHLPTHFEGAIRVRALPMERAKMFAREPAHIVLPIQATPEPKIQWQNLVGVKIDKALDDQGQDLTAVMGSLVDNQPNGQHEEQIIVNNGQVIRMMRINRGGYVGNVPVVGNQPFPIRLKKADKESTVLRELSGSMTIQIRTPAEELVSVPDVLKAKAVAITGRDASIKVIKAEKKENGEIEIDLEIQYSTEIVPGEPIPTNGRRVLTHNFMGMSLHDAKGEPFQLTRMLPRQQHYGPKSVTVTGTVAFRPLKDGQEPMKLAFNGTSLSTVDVPFTLRDVPVK